MNDSIKRSMGILVAICFTAFLPACSGSKTLSSPSGKKPTVSVASSRPCSSHSSSSPVSSAVTSAVSSASNSSKGAVTTQHTEGKPAGTTGKSTGRTTGRGGTGKTTDDTTSRNTTNGSTGGGTAGGGNGGGETGPTGFATLYYGANYGCTDASQYAYVISKAKNVENTSAYKEAYAAGKANQDIFQQEIGVPYSDEWNKAISLGVAGNINMHGKSSTGNAYNYFTGKNAVCADYAKAYEACLHTHGFNAKLCWGPDHMWTKVCVQGRWLSSGSLGLPEYGEGYNYG